MANKFAAEGEKEMKEAEKQYVLEHVRFWLFPVQNDNHLSFSCVAWKQDCWSGIRIMTWQQWVSPKLVF